MLDQCADCRLAACNLRAFSRETENFTIGRDDGGLRRAFAKSLAAITENASQSAIAKRAQRASRIFDVD